MLLGGEDMKKEERITFKCTKEQKAMIERAASIEGLATGTYLRKLALDDAKAKGFSLK